MTLSPACTPAVTAAKRPDRRNNLTVAALRAAVAHNIDVPASPVRNSAPEGTIVASSRLKTVIACIDLIGVAEAGPVLCRRDDVDQDVDPLLLDAERRNLGEGGGLDPAHASGQRAWAAPVLDGDLRAGMDFDRIGAEHVDDDSRDRADRRFRGSACPAARSFRSPVSP